MFAGRSLETKRRLYQAIFAEPAIERIDAEECARRAEGIGIPTERFHDELRSRQTVAEHEKTLQEALSWGAFGVPTFVIDEELFWGNDRLVLLRDHLQGEGLKRDS